MERREHARYPLLLVLMTVGVGIYSLAAAAALVLAGVLLPGPGSDAGTLALVLGAVYLAVAIGAGFVAAGAWRRSAWTRDAGTLVYGTFAAAALLLALLSGNAACAVIPTITSLLALGLLQGPAVARRARPGGVTEVLAEEAAALVGPAFDVRLLPR
jgi:hypothetical protein